MIHTKLELQAIEETVTRPVLVIVANDIKKLLGISTDIYTVYDVKDNIIKKKNKLGNIRGDNTTKDELINIEVAELSSENHELSLIPIRPDFKPIYIDKDINANIQPIYHSRKVSMRIRYLCRSKSKMFSVVNKLRLYTSNDGMYKQHQLTYHYTIPNHVGMLLIELNNLKNKRLETPLTLEEYLVKTFDNRFDIANSIDGNVLKSDMIIRESQIDIQGWIMDDLSQLTTEYDETSNMWALEFEYEFTYEKPISILINYPLLVYNTMVSKHFRLFEKQLRRSKNAYRTARSSDLYKLIESDRTLMPRDDNYYVTIPEMDNEKLAYPPAFYGRMFSVLTIVNDENLTELFNINEIPRIKFKDSVLKFILESEFKHISTKFESLFLVSLYKNKELDTNKIIMDADGTLRTEYPMDIKSTYRVVFHVLTDLNLLTKQAYKRVKNYFAEELRNNESNNKININNSKLDPRYKLNNSITQIDTGTMVKTYLDLISVNDAYVTKQLTTGTQPYEIPFTISDNRWLQMKTKQITMILACAMEKK